jgi:hypothetical protein
VDERIASNNAHPETVTEIAALHRFGPQYAADVNSVQEQTADGSMALVLITRGAGRSRRKQEKTGDLDNGCPSHGKKSCSMLE